MAAGIAESDWKHFRAIRPMALERYCQRYLRAIQRTAADTAKTSHDRYLVVWDLTKRTDREMAECFDDLRRSTAVLKIACIHSQGLFTEEELAGFSDAIRDWITSLITPRTKTDDS